MTLPQAWRWADAGQKDGDMPERRSMKPGEGAARTPADERDP